MTQSTTLSHEPVFAQLPKLNCVRHALLSASFLTTTPTNTVKIGTVGADGAILTKIRVKPVATTTAAIMGLFYRLPTTATPPGPDAAGVMHLYATKAMAAQTISATPTAEITATEFAMTDTVPERLPPGTEIYFGQTVANTVEVHAFWQDM